MSRWKELFDNHPIHATLNELRTCANTEFEDIDENREVEKRRFLKIVSAHEDVLKQSDPEYIPFNQLDSLQQVLTKHVSNQMTAYKGAGNLTHLVNANDQISNNLTQLSLLIAMAKKSIAGKPVKGLEDLVDAFTATFSKKKKELEGNISKLSETTTQQKERLDSLATDISKQKQVTDSLINDWQEQHSSAQHKRDTDFVADQKVRTDTYAEWRKEIEGETKTSINDLVTKSKEKLDNHQALFDDSISEYLSTAEDKHKSILDLYELVAGDSVGSGYLKSANDEKRQANFWRWATVAFIVATAAWTGYAYLNDPSVIVNDTGVVEQLKISWAKILKAFSVTGVLLFGAVYSAKQSNSHRQNEKRARWFALEVKAIDPFIASLDETEQKNLKTKLSERLFGQFDQTKDKDHQVIDEHAFSVLVKGIIDILKAK